MHDEHTEYTEPNEAACARVIELGREGFRIIEIASQMNVTADTIMKWYAEDDEFADAVALSEVHAAAKAQEWIRTAMERGFGITETRNAVKSMFRHLHPTPLAAGQELKRKERAAEFFKAKEEAEREAQKAQKELEAEPARREASEETRLCNAGWGRAETDPEKPPQLTSLLSPPDEHYFIDDEGNRVDPDGNSEGDYGGPTYRRIEPSCEREYLNGGRWLYDDEEGKFLWNAPTEETKAKRKEDEDRDAERRREKSKKSAEKQAAENRASRAAMTNYIAAVHGRD